MTPSRERAVTALLCAAGAGLVLLASGRTWATVAAQDAITPLSRGLTGKDLAGPATALGWAGLAGPAALFATKGRVRAVVGLLLTVFGAGAGYAAVTGIGRTHIVDVAGDESGLLRLGARVAVDTSAWWTVSLAGAVLLVLAGVFTMVRGGRWPGMSARYDRPGAARGPDPSAAEDPARLWKSLDRGEDPTLSDTKEH